MTTPDNDNSPSESENVLSPQTWSVIDEITPSDKELEEVAAMLAYADPKFDPILPREIVVAAKIRMQSGLREQTTDPNQLLSIVRSRKTIGQDDITPIRADTQETVQTTLVENPAPEIKKDEQVERVVSLLQGMRTVNPEHVRKNQYGVNVGSFSRSENHPFFQFGEEEKWEVLAQGMREREVDFKRRMEKALQEGERLYPYMTRTYAREMGNWGNWGSRGGEPYATGDWALPSLGIIPAGLLEDARILQNKCQEIVAEAAFTKLKQPVDKARKLAEKVCKEILNKQSCGETTIKDVRSDEMDIWLFGKNPIGVNRMKKLFPQFLWDMEVKPQWHWSKACYVCLTIAEAEKILETFKNSSKPEKPEIIQLPEHIQPQEEADASVAVPQPEPEKEPALNTGLIGELVKEALQEGAAQLTLDGKIKKQEKAVPEKKEKKHKKVRLTEQKPVFRPLGEMSEDEIYDEYNTNEQTIGEILTTNPEVDSIFEKLTRSEQEMEDVRAKIESAKQTRDNAGNDKKRRQKAIEFLEEQECRRDRLKTLLGDLRSGAQKLRKQKEELEQLRARQKDIEAKL